MRKLKLLTCVLLTFAVACSEHSEGTNQFVASWTDPTTHSAKSYWYTGETDTDYQIVERWPGKSIDYQVDKDSVTLIDVERFDVGSKSEPVKLKLANVKIAVEGS